MDVDGCRGRSGSLNFRGLKFTSKRTFSGPIRKIFKLKFLQSNDDRRYCPLFLYLPSIESHPRTKQIDLIYWQEDPNFWRRRNRGYTITSAQVSYHAMWKAFIGVIDSAVTQTLWERQVSTPPCPSAESMFYLYCKLMETPLSTSKPDRSTRWSCSRGLIGQITLG